ncbi:MAG: tetratricopeptide repeat protein, partial [Chromatiales bacterium]
TRIDNMPMYGQPEIDRPAHLVKADEDFINSVVSGFGTRKEASKAWWAQGEKHMSQGNLDFAMRRYNQAWLLNPNNYQPYWGFARVQLEKGNVDDALKYFIKAESLIDDPRRKPALLSDMGSAYSVKGSTDSSYFAKANSKFAQSTKLDPKYPNSWRLWAFSLYEQGKYRDAWKKVEMAENLRARPFPRRFLSALSEKMPRP